MTISSSQLKCPARNDSAAPKCTQAHGSSARGWPRASPNARAVPLTFEREQPDVDELMQKYSSEIDSLRGALADNEHFAAGSDGHVPYDDLWLLRFILSNPKAKNAEKAARETLEYRADNADLLSRCAAGEEHPLSPSMAPLSLSEIYSLPTEANEPVQLVRAGKANARKLMDVHTAAEVVEAMNYHKEEAFLRCDKATRRTRRLVKMVVVIDMHSQKFSDNDRRFVKAVGDALKKSELFYPQLLGVTVAINVPSYMSLLWPVVKRVLPKKTLSKVRLCSARDTVIESAACCPFATNVFQPDTLVDFLGGRAPSSEVLGPVDRPRVPY